MKTVALPSGERVPAFGLGTWHRGDDPAVRADEIATLRLGLDLGAVLIVICAGLEAPAATGRGP